MIVVHHLNNSRSQRILWLLEELNTPYRVETYRRDAKTNLAPSELRAVHPLGKSPVIQDGDLVLAESGAIIEYLLERNGNGRLVPARGTNDHVRYLHWMHFAEGTIMLHLVARLYLGRVGEAAKTVQARVEGMIGDELDLVEAELTRWPYGGRGVQRGGRSDDVPAGICRIRQARGRAPCQVARLPRPNAGPARLPPSGGQGRRLRLRCRERA